jgi:mono/diheme cytochrome c family protein
MSKRPFYVFGIFAAICLVALPIFALGKEGGERAAPVEVDSRDREGKDLFVNNCGSCHTLAAAGTDGVVGPDLDDLLVPTGVNDSGVFEGNYTRVLGAVSCGIAGRMPKGILLDEEAKSVSAFVAAYAAQLGKGPVVDTSTVELADHDGSC